MSSKKYFLLSITLIGIIGFYFFFKKTKTTDIYFTYHPNLSDLSKEDYREAMLIHQSCFEDTKRKMLFTFYKEEENGHGLSDGMLKKRIEEQILQDRARKLDTSKASQNVHLMHAKDKKIIGLFNCIDDFDFTFGSKMIATVCVKPQWRGRGLGRKLMEHAIEKCQESGKDLTLNVYQEDAHVIALYKSLGFEEITPPKKLPKEFYFFHKILMKYKQPE